MQSYFWATHQGAELDLFLIKDGRRLGVEVKRVDASTLTPSMRIAHEDLQWEAVFPHRARSRARPKMAAGIRDEPWRESWRHVPARQALWRGAFGRINSSGGLSSEQKLVDE